MGYVNESSRSPDRKYQPGTWDHVGWNPVWEDFNLETTSKTQFGYRSGPLGPEERAALLKRTGGNRATMGYTIGALEAIARAEANQVDPWMVNTRDYMEFRARPTEMYSKCEYKIGATWRPTRSRGAYGIIDIQPSSLPTKPSDADLQNWSSAQIRNMRPTKPDFRLARFLGELRDANKMFRPDSYFLTYFASTRTALNQYRNVKLKAPSIHDINNDTYRKNNSGHFVTDAMEASGKASLNYQFAVIPTAADIKKGAEAVLSSEKIIKQYLRDMDTIISRSGRRVIDTKTFTGRIGWTTVSPWNLPGNSLAGMTVKGIPGANHPDIYKPILQGYLNTRLEQRVFSTYRYAPENSGALLNVFDSYVGEAQKVLGLRLDLQTVWDLLPFSWMVDWFLDIGGLLGYQQDVADYGLVSQRAGYVLEWTGHGSVSPVMSGADDTYTRGRSIISPGLATVVYKKQARRSGNPYGMTPTWNLNPFQWGILGSLGMAWAPNAPVFRRG